MKTCNTVKYSITDFLTFQARRAAMKPRSHVVINDFLSPSQFQTLWAYFVGASFRGVHQVARKKVYRLYDGEPFAAEQFYRDRCTDAEELPLPLAIQAFYDALINNVDFSEFASSIGPWDSISFQAFAYPINTGLNWHIDRGRLFGFVFYAHPMWRPSWGGELLIADDQQDLVRRSSTSDLDTFLQFYKGADELLNGGGAVGRFISACPNCLVLIRGGVPHCIKKVEIAAGEGFRASLVGFFGRN